MVEIPVVSLHDSVHVLESQFPSTNSYRVAVVFHVCCAKFTDTREPAGRSVPALVECVTGQGLINSVIPIFLFGVWSHVLKTLLSM